MAGEASTAKICTVCAQDCSTRQRAKDKEGRYTCKECMDRAMQAKAAKQIASGAATPLASAAAAKPATVNLDDNSFILDIAKAPLPKGKTPCAACGKPVDDAAVLCIHCGYNKKTGDKLSVRVLKPQELKLAKKNSAGYEVKDNGPMAIGIVLLLMYVGLYLAAQSDPKWFLGLAMAVLISGLWIWIGTLIHAFGTGIIHAVLVFFLFPYQLYYAFFRSESAFLKWGNGAMIIGYGLLVIGMADSGS